MSCLYQGLSPEAQRSMKMQRQKDCKSQRGCMASRKRVSQKDQRKATNKITEKVTAS